MNMVLCAQDCKHQREGYCSLNEISGLSDIVNPKCSYYQKADKLKTTTERDEMHPPNWSME